MNQVTFYEKPLLLVTTLMLVAVNINRERNLSWMENIDFNSFLDKNNCKCTLRIFVFFSKTQSK